MKGKVLQTLASRNELKVAKLEIDSLYICEKIPYNIEAITKVYDHV